MLPIAYATPAAAVLVLVGLVTCFAGYRLFRIVLGFFGFVLGAMIGTTIAGSSSGTWTLILVAVMGGIVGAVLMVAAYFVGIGLVGAGLAVLGLNAFWTVIGGEPPTLLLVIVAVVGALVALSIVRYVAIFGTAIAGSWTFIIGALALMGDPKALLAASAGSIWVLYPLSPVRGDWWVWAGWFGLSIAGIVVQLATTTKMGTKKKS
jgi:hypothetical protein